MAPEDAIAAGRRRSITSPETRPPVPHRAHLLHAKLSISPLAISPLLSCRHSSSTTRSAMAVRIEKSGSVWTVIHSRPEARNAMDARSADDLVAAFEAFDADTSANVAVFWGEGGAFCAGWDLKSVSSLDRSDPVRALDFPKDGGKAPRGPLGPSRLELSKPVIAAVEGPAVAGGMELAMWCDVQVMAESAYFGVYCRRWGVPLIDGGTVRLPRLVGMGRAMEAP